MHTMPEDHGIAWIWLDCEVLVHCGAGRVGISFSQLRAHFAHRSVHLSVLEVKALFVYELHVLGRIVPC